MSRKPVIAKVFTRDGKQTWPRKPYRCVLPNRLALSLALQTKDAIPQRLLPARFFPISLLDTPRKASIMKPESTPIR